MTGLVKFPFTLLIAFLLMYLIIAYLINLQQKKPPWPLFVSQIFSLSLILYAVWPLMPPGMVGREVTANNFLSALSAGNSEQALDLIPRYTPMSKEEKEQFITDITNPDNLPISWSITSINRLDIVIADVELADGTKDEIVLTLNWDWGKARWGVSSVLFQNETDRLRFFGPIGFTNRFPYIPYSLFGSITLMIGIIVLLNSLTYLPNVRKIFT